MLLTDRNFNTCFFDPALRHSIVPIFDVLSNDAFYHSVYTETASGLLAGADSNEDLFLGAMNSASAAIVSSSSAFPKLISITRPAKAKVPLKTGSTNEALIVCNMTNKRTNRINLHDTKGRVYYCGSILGRILIIIPEQNQSLNRSPNEILNLVGSYMNNHSGNPGKYTYDILSVHTIKCIQVKVLTGEPLINRDSVQLPTPFKFSKQEGISLYGGKIVDQANVFGNAKNKLNSIRLNNANQ